MVDIKKINIKPGDIFGKINDLAERIPDNIAKTLKMVGISIFVIGCLISIFNGYQEGFANAKEEGMELAKDTKALFLEDIERTYNRKRKDVRAGGDLNSLLSNEDYKPQKFYQSYERENDTREGNQPLIESKGLPLEKEGAIQEIKSKGDVAPLAEIYNNAGNLSPETAINEPKRNYKPLKDEFQAPNNRDNNFYERSLRESPNYNTAIIDRKPQTQGMKFDAQDPTILKDDRTEKPKRERLINSRKRNSSDRIITPE